ncbi:hypothetical protein CHLRE_17g743597v5 [Chlamydomonas reinhardtii]|uniref:Uncharacterized protein n=1 Tax=Chlamydomonas reinhardtii TaxID=3055 RepID=A0A2K3CRX4_CHLRE|nr:uncharacterized protein CHLRE_17g743597v5 [Chlamydomonas reinhardtii]PNW71033.1 hypothetical protein CHLRE_17g743597v5 [Chlamydomonas reinhardtii]7PKQ_P Chain P, mS107 [Chlamydomonas reinhardtii]
MRKRELLNEARALVPEGSGWLEAYTRNISPRQLTWRLGKRDSLAAMTEGWQLYQGKFDTVAMAALLRRLRHAQLQDPGFDPLAAQRLLDDLVPRLRSVGLRFGKLRDITAYLHALAKLRSPAPSASSSAASPRAGAAAASLLTQPDALVLDLAVFATRNRTELLHASPQRLATLLWALMRLLPPQLYGSEQLQVVLDRMALASLGRLQNFAPLDLRWAALAFATFGPHGPSSKATATTTAAAAGTRAAAGAGSGPALPEWPRVVRGEAAAAATAGAQGAEDVTARRQSRNARVIKALCDELAARSGNLALPQPEPRDLALAAHALGLVAAASSSAGGAVAPPALLVKAAGVAARSLPALSGEEAVGLVETLAVWGLRQPALLEALRDAAGRWGEGEQAEALRGRLQAAYTRLGVEL